MKTRNEIAREEATMNPIFLFQVRRIHISESVGVVSDDGVEFRHGIERVSLRELIEQGDAAVSWDTCAVFATRKEAEDYGSGRPYAWGKMGEGWRVYCVPAYGALIRALESLDC